MYDNIRSKDYNPQNCLHLACSEIRAANLSGYCADDYSYIGTLIDSTSNKRRNQNCVKSKANEHMMVYYEHCAEKSNIYISEAWNKCFMDTSPVRDFSKQKSYL